MAKVRRHPRVAKREVEVVRHLSQPNYITHKELFALGSHVLFIFTLGMSLGYFLYRLSNHLAEHGNQ